MPDAAGNFKGIAVTKLWPGHRDYTPAPAPRRKGCIDARPCYEVGCDHCYFKVAGH